MAEGNKPAIEFVPRRGKRSKNVGLPQNMQFWLKNKQKNPALSRVLKQKGSVPSYLKITARL